MNKLLSANLQVWHLFVGLAVLVALGAGGVVMARPAPPPSIAESTGGVTPAAFFPSGSFHMTANVSHDNLTVKSTDGEKSVLHIAFTVPAGQLADIVGLFNAEAYKYPNGYCYLKFHMDSSPSAMNPGELWVADGFIYKGGYPTISAQGYKVNVGPGSHQLDVSLLATGGDCFVDDRSLVVLASFHP
jgi:hypothetical protein